MIDPGKVAEFLDQHDVKIKVKDYGKGVPQLMFTCEGSSIPVGPEVLQPILALMTTKGAKFTF